MGYLNMIRAKVISEVLGSPQEHVDKTLNLLIDKLKERKELNIGNEKIFQAEKIENKQLFSGFIEYEINVENLNQLSGFCFDFMPSSIEILEPDELKTSSVIIGELFNEILARLHQNDMFLRNTIAELAYLKKKSEKK